MVGFFWEVKMKDISYLEYKKKLKELKELQEYNSPEEAFREGAKDTFELGEKLKQEAKK